MSWANEKFQEQFDFRGSLANTIIQEIRHSLVNLEKGATRDFWNLDQGRESVQEEVIEMKIEVRQIQFEMDLMGDAVREIRQGQRNMSMQIAEIIKCLKIREPCYDLCD